MIMIENKFELGQKVYLVTETAQSIWIITGIQICASGGLLYRCSCGNIEYWAVDYEISTEKVMDHLLPSEKINDT